MAVRQDQVQLRVDFITDEGRQLARTLLTTKEYNKEISSSTAKIAEYQKQLAKVGADESKRAPILAKIAAEEKKVADNLARIAAEGKKVEALDLGKVAPAQLVERAKQLAQAIRLIPQSAPQFKQLQSELSAVNARLREINQTASAGRVAGAAGGGIFGTLGTLISSGGRALPVIGAVITAFQALRGAFTGANNLEQLNVAFETFLGNADAAKQVVGELIQFANVTPFETEQVTQAGKALLAFGFTAESLIPTLTQIGDVASGTGKDFNELVLIYGKAAAEGKIQNDTLNQLAEAGIPVYAELAKVLGVNQEQIRKLAEQGKIQFTDLQAVFTNLTAEGGRFNGLMERQSQTLGGLFSTFTSELKGVLTQLGTALAPLVKQILEVGIYLVQKFGTTFSTVFRGVGGTLNGFYSAARYTFEAVSNSIQVFALKVQLGYAKVLDFFGSDQAARIQELEGKLSAASATAGGSISESFIAGFNAVWQPATGETIQDASKPGKANAVTRAITPNPEEAKKRVEAAFQTALKAVEVGIRRQELLLENQRIKGEITEAQYQNRLLDIQQQGLNNRLEVFRQFHRSEEVEALEAQNKLEQLERRRASRFVPGKDNTAQPGLSDIPELAAPLSNAETSRRARLAELPGREENTQRALEERFARLLITEQDYEMKRLELKKAFIEEELALLRASIEPDAALITEKESRKRDIELEITRQRIENEKKSAEIRQQLQEAQNQLFTDSVNLAIELLGRDEAARKRNAGAIKAFQVAQVTVQGIAEVQKIWAGAAELGPILGPIIGAIQTAAAVARTITAISKIQATKFARGGYTGGGSGTPDETGFRPAGIVHEGEYVAPKWMVQSRETAPVIRWLENRRLRGFATGGLVTVNTTPTALPSVTSATAPVIANMDEFVMAVQQFTMTVARFPKEVKSRVVYTEIEEVGEEVNSVRADAAI